MKIALCFFGKTHGFQTNYSGIWPRPPTKQKKIRCLHGIHTIRENVMQNHDVDVYFHAWVNSELTTQDLCDFLKPRKFKSEKQKKFAEGIRQQGYLSHFYSRTESLKMALDSQIEYDLIVAIRYDVIFFNPVKYENVKPDILYADGDVPTKDWHIVGHPSVIKKLLSMFDFAKEKIANGIKLDSTSRIYNAYYKLHKIEKQTLLYYNPKGVTTVPRDTDFCLVRSLPDDEIDYLEYCSAIRVSKE